MLCKWYAAFCHMIELLRENHAYDLHFTYAEVDLITYRLT